MQDVIKKSIEQLNEVLTKEKKLVIKKTTPLIDEKSKLESIDIVNLFINLEKNTLQSTFFVKIAVFTLITDHILTQKIMNIMSPVSTILILLNIRIFQFLMEKNYKNYEYFG